MRLLVTEDCIRAALLGTNSYYIVFWAHGAENWANTIMIPL